MVRQNKTDRGICHGNYARCAGAALLFLLALACVPCGAATIRTKTDMRLWQTVTDRSAPLAWPWAEGADTATLSFSNRVTRVVSTVMVSREGTGMRGSCAQPAPQTGEAIIDVTLIQTGDGGAEVSRESATLAYVSGVRGGPITVRANPGTREWERVRNPRVFAFDPAWRGETGESGYDIAWPNYKRLAIIIR